MISSFNLEFLMIDARTKDFLLINECCRRKKISNGLTEIPSVAV